MVLLETDGEFFPVYSINTLQLVQLKLSEAINLKDNNRGTNPTNKSREVNNSGQVISHKVERNKLAKVC